MMLHTFAPITWTLSLHALRMLLYHLLDTVCLWLLMF